MRQTTTIDRYTWAFLNSKLPRTDAREERKRKIAYLAEKLGITEKMMGYVASCERNLSTENAEKLASLYGLSHLEMLMRGQELSESSFAPSDDRPETNSEIEILDKHTLDLVEMTKEILQSKSKVAGALKENIEAFHHTLEIEKNVESLTKRVAALEGMIKNPPNPGAPAASSKGRAI